MPNESSDMMKRLAKKNGVESVYKFKIDGDHQYHMAIIKWWCDNGFFNPRCHELTRFRDSPMSYFNHTSYYWCWQKRKPKRHIAWFGHTGFRGTGKPMYLESEIHFMNMADEATIFRLTW